jgi:hypothetical protein
MEYNDKMEIGETSSDYKYLIDHIEHQIDFYELLRKYGPEGLYAIADRLKEIADEDMREALTVEYFKLK